MSTRERALEILAAVSRVPVERIEPDMELVANLGLDSAKALELLVELEDRLGVVIDDDDAARLNTVGDVLAYLERAGA